MCNLVVIFLFQVQPKHVKEAFRLLNKSIIRVETPDINLDQEEEEAMEEDDEQMNGRVILYCFFLKLFFEKKNNIWHMINKKKYQN